MASNIKIKKLGDIFGEYESVTMLKIASLKGVGLSCGIKGLAESVREYGVIEPGIARKLKDGAYEVITGSKRAAACMALGIDTMPFIVRNYSDAETARVSKALSLSNSQVKEYPEIFNADGQEAASEKALRYREVFDAEVKERRKKGEKNSGRADEAAARRLGIGRNTLNRYIRLTYIVDSLLALIDVKKLSVAAGVELSYLEDYDLQEKIAGLIADGYEISQPLAAKITDTWKKNGGADISTLLRVELRLTKKRDK